MVKQHRVFLLAKEAKDTLDKRLFLSIVLRARGGKASGKDGIVHRERNEQQKGDKPDTGYKESHDLEHTVARWKESQVKKTCTKNILLAIRLFSVKPIVPHYVLDDKRNHGSDEGRGRKLDQGERMH